MDRHHVPTLVPMTALSEFTPDHPLADDDALLAFARFVHGDVRPRRRTLWSVLLDGERRPLPVIVPVDLVPDEPEVLAVNDLGQVWHDILGGEPGASVLVMLERPGAATASITDHAWFVALRDTAARHGLALAAFFLATADDVARLDQT